MKSSLDIQVSCFKNYRTSDNPKPVSLLQWLRSPKYAGEVEKIRKINDKHERDKLKATLPAITPSGLFSYRSKKNLVQHSGFIQFDIDGKDHSHLMNFSELRNQIANIVNVAYVGLSVSGQGYWGLVPIKYPAKHKRHFRALRDAFAKFGLQLDDKPSNVASLRGYSFDPNGYFNHHAIVFESLDEQQVIPKTSCNNQKNDYSDVEQLIRTIQSNRIDITNGYDNWLRIAFAFAEEFGEAGREYFHAVSQYHPKYNPRKTDRQFTHCLRAGGNGITIASFFHICKEHRITLNKVSGTGLIKKDRPLEAKSETGQKKAPKISRERTDEDADYKQAMEKDPILKHLNDLFQPEIIG